jgi:hypothetical protein
MTSTAFGYHECRPIAAPTSAAARAQEYELYLAVEDIDHSRTKAKSPQTTDEVEYPFSCGRVILRASRASTDDLETKSRAGGEGLATLSSLPFLL